MASVSSVPSGHAAVGDLLHLRDEASASEVVLAARRGALVTSFRVRERELLYLDPTTLNDAGKNVRGGIPVLFPSPGKLEGDIWRWIGRTGGMKQHGFARNLPWNLVGTHADEHGALVTLGLESDETTRSQYPWDFRVELSFGLSGARLRIASSVTNHSQTPMPFALGYHPYFHVTNKALARIDTHATRAFDNVTKQIVPFDGFDLTAAEVDLHLLDHGSTHSALHFGDGSRLELSASVDYSHWVVWTLAGKEFVCVEPWTAPGNAINSGERLTVLKPGEQHASFVEFAVVE